jgi:fatty-acyl-CoA synthase
MHTSLPRPTGFTLAQVVAETALHSPARPAILFGGRAISYAELTNRVNEAALALLASGVVRGDRVGVLLGNTPEWVVLALASAAIGATCVPLNTWYRSGELRWNIAHCGLKLLISSARFLKTDYVSLLTELIPELGGAEIGQLNSNQFPTLQSVIFVGDEIPRRLFGWDSFLASASALSISDLSAATKAVTEQDIAFILYTSGSTAEPKGVMLNHRGLVANGFELGARRGIVNEDRVWLGSPLFYALGATNALPAAFTRGAALVLQGHFDARSAIEVIESTKATVFYGTGNMAQAILDHPEYRQSRIGTLQKGNAGTMTTYKRLTLLEMGISGAVPAYGLTETYGNATVGYPDDPLEAKLETSGVPLANMEMRIVNPSSGTELPRGEVGLVLIRGHTTPGYFANAVETGKALRPDGFFDTGDLGFFDGDGRFHFHSRLKEVIKTGGINVSPAEVEQIITAHPAVRDAHVLGVVHPTRGELVVAIVDAKSSLAVEEVQAFVKARAAAFKVPHYVLFRQEDQLPRLASGKVAKYKLAEEAKRELGL